MVQVEDQNFAVMGEEEGVGASLGYNNKVDIALVDNSLAGIVVDSARDLEVGHQIGQDGEGLQMEEGHLDLRMEESHQDLRMEEGHLDLQTVGDRKFGVWSEANFQRKRDLHSIRKILLF